MDGVRSTSAYPLTHRDQMVGGTALIHMNYPVPVVQLSPDRVIGPGRLGPLISPGLRASPWEAEAGVERLGLPRNLLNHAPGWAKRHARHHLTHPTSFIPNAVMGGDDTAVRVGPCLTSTQV
uniref:Uncharacterized protein n=1 Tax=Coccidioides posadasii RMSCC 3488 TaxID=454284 RepID=A0A0J6F716_COCPO|nr:hypothetical protein CPAG_02319 [Coccidioides posadasii RMSCC 3488]